MKILFTCGPDITDDFFKRLKSVLKTIDKAKSERDRCILATAHSPDAASACVGAYLTKVTETIVGTSKGRGSMDWKPVERRNGDGMPPTAGGCPKDCEFTVTFCGECVYADVPGNFAFAYLCEVAGIGYKSAKWVSRQKWLWFLGGPDQPDAPPETDDTEEMDQQLMDAAGDAAKKRQKRQDDAKGKKESKPEDDQLREEICKAIKAMSYDLKKACKPCGDKAPTGW